MSDVTVDNTPQAQPAAGENIINLTDLQNILVVFDLASNRGAFRGNELEPVGQLYNKISKFVQAAMPPQAAAEGQPETQGV
jgi:hypothetical protein